MVAVLKVLALGTVQGLTEFLPVSSSAHLVLFQQWFGLKEPELFFDVALHLGTLLAVFVYYRKDIAEVVAGIFGGIGDALGRKMGFVEMWKARTNFRLAMFIVLASFPTACIGFAFKDFFEAMFGSLRHVSFALLITAGVLWSSRVWSRRTSFSFLDWKRALFIGLAQGIAIMPGISRSGITIVAALACGLESREAVKFSFFLAILSIAGASILELGSVAPPVSSFSLVNVAVGMGAAFLTGLFSIFFLLRVVERGKLHSFAYYCAAASGAAFLTSWLAR